MGHTVSPRAQLVLQRTGDVAVQFLYYVIYGNRQYFNERGQVLTLVFVVL